MKEEKTNFTLALAVVGVVAILAIFGIYSLGTTGSSSNDSVFDSHTLGDNTVLGQAFLPTASLQSNALPQSIPRSFITPTLVLPARTVVQLGGFTFEYVDSHCPPSFQQDVRTNSQGARPPVVTCIPDVVLRVNGEQYTYSWSANRDGLYLENSMGERIRLMLVRFSGHQVIFTYSLVSSGQVPQELFRVSLDPRDPLTHQGLRFELLDVSPEQAVLRVSSQSGAVEYVVDRFSTYRISDFHTIHSVTPDINLFGRGVTFWLESDYRHQLPTSRTR